MTPTYAADTTVPVEKSRMEIEVLLKRYGADGLAYQSFETNGIHTIGFRIKDVSTDTWLVVRMTLALPLLNDRMFATRPYRGYTKSNTPKLCTSFEGVPMKPANQMSLEAFRAKLDADRPSKAPSLIPGVQPSPERVRGGRDAQSGGKAFEECLEITHDVYRTNGVADIFRLPVETQPMPRTWLKDPTKGGIARLLAKRQRADYLGTLKGGRCIQMEAKSTIAREKSLPIRRPDQDGFGLKAHQLSSLVNAYKLGALVAVVWRNGPEGLVLVGPDLARFWEEFRLAQRTRIQAAEAHPYDEPSSLGVRVHDWLRVAEEKTPQ